MRKFCASIIAAALIFLSPGSGSYQAFAGLLRGEVPTRGGVSRVSIRFPQYEMPYSGLQTGSPTATYADIEASGPYREIRLRPLKAIPEHAAENSITARAIAWPGRFLASLAPNLSDSLSFQWLSYLPFHRAWMDPGAKAEAAGKEWTRWFDSQVDHDAVLADAASPAMETAEAGPVRITAPLLKARLPGSVAHARVMPGVDFSLAKPVHEKELAILVVHGATETEARRNLGHVLRGLQVVVKQTFKERWEEYVENLQKLSLVPFFFLIIPQALKNFANLTSGHPEELDILKKWIGWPSGSLADMGMVLFFQKLGEGHRYAMMVQIFGIVMSSVVLTQIWWAGHVPTAFLAGQLAFVGAGLSIVALDAMGKLPEPVWKAWSDFVGIAQQAFLPVAVCLTVAESVPLAAMAIPAGVAAILVILFRNGILKRYHSLKALHDFMRYFNGWNSTMLFAVGPICQLIANYLHPESIAGGLSPETFMLNIIGNGLMLAMALLMKSGIWFVGSSFAVSIGGVGQLFGMYYFNALNPVYFLAASGAVYLWMRFILEHTRRYFGDSSVWSPLMRLRFKPEAESEK
ncbi:MAG: hypothetical protein HY921_08445 [Elusimicrobia bacterium]|nr:hypothetical protein [Elusimicrobiota bacterium]